MKLSKLIIPLLLAIALGIGIVACTGKTTNKTMHIGVEYYRNLLFNETPYDIEKGIHPLTADQAKTINNYKFTYDKSGRLLSVEFVRNNVLLGYSSMQGAAKITYDYKDNKQIKHFFNKDNEPIESAGVFALEYSLDPNGNRAGLMCLGKDGSMIENRNKIHSWTWTVLPNGMVKELRYNLKGEETVMNPFCPFYELRFTYNDKGYPTRMANFKADTLYNCTAENCGDIGVSYFTFATSQYGDLENFSVFNVTGQMSNLYWGWSKQVSKYDENGNLLETRLFDQDNEYVGGKLIPVIQASYDSHGARLELKNMDKNGNLINSPDNGVAITDYKYDEVGNRTETLSFDKDKVAVNLTAQK
jgi:YD repeat-containing protein